MLAQSDDGKALIGCARHTFLNRGLYGLVECMVSKIRQDMRDARQVPDAS